VGVKGREVAPVPSFESCPENGKKARHPREPALISAEHIIAVLPVIENAFVTDDNGSAGPLNDQINPPVMKRHIDGSSTAQQ